MTDQNNSYQEQPTSPWSIISLISGISNFVVFPFWGAVVALITGYVANADIEKSQGRLGGERLAKAGLILGWVGIGLGVLTFCLSVLMIFGLIGSFALCGPISSYFETLRW